jgi:hypothetical protein
VDRFFVIKKKNKKHFFLEQDKIFNLVNIYFVFIFEIHIIIIKNYLLIILIIWKFSENYLYLL